MSPRFSWVCAEATALVMLAFAAAATCAVAPPTLTAPPHIDVTAGTVAPLRGLHVDDAMLGLKPGTLLNVSMTLDVATGVVSVPDRTGILAYFESAGALSLVAAAATMDDVLSRVVITIAPLAPTGGAVLTVVASTIAPWAEVSGPATVGVALLVSECGDKPRINAPAVATVDEDAVLVVTDVSVSSCVPLHEFLWGITASVGAVLVNGSAAPVRGPLATIAAVLAAPRGILFMPQPDWNSGNGRGVVVLTFTLFDTTTSLERAASARATMDVVVSPVNDAPAAAGPARLTAMEGGSVSLAGISIADSDCAEVWGCALVAELSVAHGALAVDPSQAQIVPCVGQTGDAVYAVFARAPGIQRVCVRGRPDAVTAAVGRGLYSPDAEWFGNDVLNITVSNMGANGRGGQLSASLSIPIAVSSVNSPPTVVAPVGLLVTPEDTPLAITGISVADAELGETGSIHVTVTPAVGRVALGATSYWVKVAQAPPGVRSREIDMHGPVASVNAALAGMVYTPAPGWNSVLGGADTIIIVVDDGGGVTQGSGGVQVATATVYIRGTPVNDAPTIAVATTLAMDEDVPATFQVVVSDVDASDYPWPFVSVSIAFGSGGCVAVSPFQGTMVSGELAAPSVPGKRDCFLSPMSVAGLAADVNVVLFAATYVSATDWWGTDTMRFTVTDCVTSAGEATQISLTATATSAVSVASVNDAPVISAPAWFLVLEDSTLPVTGVSVADVDLNAGGAEHVLSVEVSCGSGRVSIGGAEAGGVRFATDGVAPGAGGRVSAPVLAFAGTLTGVNAALASLRYSPNSNFAGSDTLALAASDGGWTGAGGVRVGSANIMLTVTPVNDPPVITVPRALRTVQANSSALVGGISVTDADATGRLSPVLMSFTVTATSGCVSMTDEVDAAPSFASWPHVVAMLHFDVGSRGLPGRTLSVRGALSRINSALQTLRVFGPQAPGCVDGSLLAFRVLEPRSVLEFQAGDGVGSAVAEIPIDILAANDPPVVSTGVPPAGGFSTDEDVPLPLRGVFSVRDRDIGSGALRLYVVASFGCVSGSFASLVVLDTSSRVSCPSGSAAALNVTGGMADAASFISSLVYTPSSHWTSTVRGEDSVSVSASDGASSVTAAVSILVFPVDPTPRVVVARAPEVTAIAECTGGADVLLDVFTIVDPSADSRAAGGERRATFVATVAASSGSVRLHSYAGLSVSDAVAGESGLAMTAVDVLIKQAFLSQVTLTGTAAALTAAISPLNFLASTCAEGIALIAIDVANVAAPEKSETGSASIVVGFAYEAPVLKAPTSVVGVENTLLEMPTVLLTTGKFTDAVLCTINASFGVLSLSSTVSGLVETGSTSRGFTFKADVAAAAAALARIVYTPPVNYASSIQGTDVVEISVTDISSSVSSGSLGAGLSLSSSCAVKVIITNVASPPVLVVSATAISAVEDVGFAMAGLLDVRDADGDDTIINVLVSVVSGGVVTAPPFGAVVIEATTRAGQAVPVWDLVQSGGGGFGVALAVFAFSATVANARSVLNGLSYIGAPESFGVDTITIAAVDGAGLSAAATIEVSITASNDPPVLFVPKAMRNREGACIALTDVTFGDDDVGTGAVFVTVSASHGSFEFDMSGANEGAELITKQPSSTVTFVGGEAAAVALLATLMYCGDEFYNGVDTVSFTVGDHRLASVGVPRSTTAQFDIVIAPVNDAPVVTAPKSLAVVTGMETRVPSVSVFDPDVSEPQLAPGKFAGLMSVTVTAVGGAVRVEQQGGVFVKPAGVYNSTVSLMGLPSAIDAALATMFFLSVSTAPLPSVAESITVVVDDLGNAGGAAQVVSAVVSVARTARLPVPVVAAPHMLSGMEDVAMGLPGVAISLPPDASVATELVDVELRSLLGTITLSAAMDAKVIVLQDSWVQGTLEDSLAMPRDGPNLIREWRTLQLRGLLADVNSAIAGATYRPRQYANGLWASNESFVSGRVTPPVREALLILSVVSRLRDCVDTAPLNVLSAAVGSARTLVSIEWVNNAPTITAPTSVLLAGSSSSIVRGISVADVDVAEMVSGRLTVRVSCFGGTVSFSPVALLAAGYIPAELTVPASSHVLVGTPRRINAALTALVYNPADSLSVSDVIRVNVSDSGDSGSGGPGTAMTTVLVALTPAIGPPALSQAVGEPPVIPENSNVALSGIRVSYRGFDARAVSAGFRVNAGNLLAAYREDVKITSTTGGGVLQAVVAAAPMILFVAEEQRVVLVAPSVSEVQGVLTASTSGTVSGTFRIIIAGEYSPPILAAETGPQLLNKLRSMTLAGQYIQAVTVRLVSGSAQSYQWNITFVPSAGNIGPIAVNSSLTRGTVSVRSIARGASPGGTFVLAFGGASTAPIPWDAADVAVAAALNGLTTVFHVNVSRATNASGFVWTVTFSPSHGSTPKNDGDLALLTVDSLLLAGSLTVEESVKGSSPMAGRFALTASGVQTGLVSIDASSDEVAAALSGLSVYADRRVSVSRASITQSSLYGFIWTVLLWSDAPKLNVVHVGVTPGAAVVYCGEWLSSGALVGSPSALTALLSSAFVAPLPFFNSVSGGYLAVAFELSDAAPSSGGNAGMSKSVVNVFVEAKPSSPLMTAPEGPLVTTENSQLYVPGLTLLDMDNATATTPASVLSLSVTVDVGSVTLAPTGGVTLTAGVHDGVAPSVPVSFPVSLISVASHQWSAVTLSGHGEALAAALAGTSYAPRRYWSVATARGGWTDEVQVIVVEGGPPLDVHVVVLEVTSGVVKNGTFLLVLHAVGSSAVSTTPLQYNASASAMSAALSVLSNAPTGSSILVAKGATAANGDVSWSITTTGGLGNATLSVVSSVVARCVGSGACPAPKMSVTRLRSATDRIAGTWTVSHGAAPPVSLAVDATAAEVKAAIGVARAVSVSRSQVLDAGGYAWSVTFALGLDPRNACGQPLLAVDGSKLAGYGAVVEVSRVVEGTCDMDSIRFQASAPGASPSLLSVSVMVLPSPAAPVVSTDRPYEVTSCNEGGVLEVPVFSVGGVGGGNGRVFSVTVASTSGGRVYFSENSLHRISVVGTCALPAQEARAFVCFGGLLADVNTALRALFFAPAPHANGFMELSVTASAASVTAGSGVVSTGAAHTRKWGVLVTPVNDAPTVKAPVELILVAGTPALVLGISIGDVDAGDAGGDGLIDVTVSCGGCVLTLAARERASVHHNGGDGASELGGPTISFSASVARAAGALNALRCLVGNARIAVPDAITVFVSDRGNVGAGGLLTATGRIALVVESSNPPPVIVVPASRYVGKEGVALALDGIAVTDEFAPDAGAGAYLLTVSAHHGTLTVAPDTAISVAPGEARGGIVVRGNLAGLVAAVRTLQFRPLPHWAGLDDVLLTITTSRGGTGVGVARVFIAQVNDAPVVIPATRDATVNAAGSLSLASFTVADVDAELDASTALDVVVSCTAGHIVVQAPWRRLADCLRDPDAAAESNLRALVPFGLQLPGGEPADSKRIRFAGAVPDVNSALAAIVFAAPSRWRGTAVLSITVTDAGGLTAVGTFTIAVVMPHLHPSVTPCRSPTLVVQEDTKVQLPPLAVDNPNTDAATRAISVTLVADDGDVFFGKAPSDAVIVTRSRGAMPRGVVVTLLGVGADIAPVLASLVVVPVSNFVGRIRVYAAADETPRPARTTQEWAQSVHVALLTIDFLPVNDAPVVSCGRSIIRGVQDSPAVLISIELTDADANEENADMQLAVSTSETGSVAFSQFVGGVMIAGNATTKFVATGSLWSLRALVESGALVVLPKRGFVGDVAISVELVDNDGAVGSCDSVAAFADVPDGPVLSFPDSSVSFWSDMAEDDGSVALPTVLLTDLDAAAHKTVPVTLHISCTSGNIGVPPVLVSRVKFLSASTISSVPAGAAAFTDAVLAAATEDAAALLASLLYVPAPNFNGVDEVKISIVRELLQSDSRVPARTVYGIQVTPLSGSVWVRVSAVNDAPSIVAPSLVPAVEDTRVNVAGIALLDPDAADDFVSGAWLLVVSLDEGASAKIDAVGGFAVSNGEPLDGGKAWSLLGELASLNSALQTLRVMPATDFVGVAHLSVAINDNGIAGMGGPFSASVVIDVDFVAVDDPPVVSVAISAHAGAPVLPSLRYAASTVVITQGIPFALGAVGVAGGGDASILAMVADVDATADAVFSVRVALQDSSSLVELPASYSGIRVLANGGNTLVMQGVAGDVNAALGAVIISVGFAVSHEVLTFDVIDDYAALTPSTWGSAFAAGEASWPPVTSPLSSDAVRLDVAKVNHAPTLSLGGSFVVHEDVTTPLGNSVSVSDPDMQTAISARDGVLTFSVSAGRGVLSLPLVPGVWITRVTSDRAVQSRAVVREPYFTYGNELLPNGGVGTTVAFRCSETACNDMLAALSYTSPLDYFGDDTISVLVSDGGYSGVGGSLQATAVLRVTVTPVDDAPVITAPSSITAVEGSDSAISVLTLNGIRVDDVDLGSGVLFVTLGVANGALVLSRVDELKFTVGGAAGGPALEFVGQLEDVNKALQFLVYRADQHYNGLDVMTMAVSDGTLTSRATVPVVVEAIDTLPVVTVPNDAVQMQEDSVLNFRNAGVDVHDADGGDLVVAVRAAHGGVLGVQTISTTTAIVNDVQDFGLAGTGLSGTFTLTLSRTSGASATTSPIVWNATARTAEEVVGGFYGARPGQSLESRLAALSTFAGLSVDAVRTVVASGDQRWRVTFYGAESAFPLLRISVAGVTVTSGTVLSFVTPVVNTTQVGGTFTVAALDSVSRPLGWNTTARALKQALEALPPVGTVDVTRSGPGLNLGYVWTVTFFAPAGPPPLLRTNSSNLIGAGASASVAVVTTPLGWVSVSSITTMAVHVNEVQLIATNATSGSLTGGFSLAMDFSSWGDGAPLVTTSPINWNAVGNIADESLTHALGNNYGESVQFKLQAAFAAAAAATYPGPVQDDLAAMTVSVTRAGPWVHASYAWYVTFYGARASLPVLALASHTLQTAGSVTVTTSVYLAENLLGGTFTVTIGESTTPPLATTTSSATLRSALLALPSFVDAGVRIGDVVVTRSEASHEGGYTWLIAFTQSPLTWHDALSADASGLTGIGAAAFTRIVAAARAPDVLSLGALAGVSMIRDELSMRAGGEDSINGTDALGRQYGTSVGTTHGALIFRGPLRRARAALQSVRYVPPQDWFGTVVISVAASDGVPGSTLTWVTRAFVVNVAPASDVPRLVTPAMFYAIEDGDIVLIGVKVVHGNVRTGILTVKVSTLRGFVAVFKEQLTANIALVGTIAEVNAALATLRYRSLLNVNGLDVVGVRMDDGAGGVTEAAVRIYVAAENDKPYVNVVSGYSQTIVQETRTVVSGVSVSDPDVNEYNSTSDNFMQLSLLPRFGVVSFGAPYAGVSVWPGVLTAAAALHVNDDAALYNVGKFVNVSLAAAADARARVVLLRGGLSALNALLATMFFTSDDGYYGQAALRLVADDGGNTGIGGSLNDTQVVVFNVTWLNHPTVVHAPFVPLPVDEDAEVAIGVTLSDLDVPHEWSMGHWEPSVAVAVQVESGTVSLDVPTPYGLTLTLGTGVRSSALVFSGAFSIVSSALALVRYRSAQNWNSRVHGFDFVHVSADDEGHGFVVGTNGLLTPNRTARDASVIADPSMGVLVINVVAVNDAPVISLPNQVLDPVLRTGDSVSFIVDALTTYTVTEDVPVSLIGTGVRDIDAAEVVDGLVLVTVSSAHGLVSLNRGARAPVAAFVVGTGSRDTFLSFRATVSDANAALTGLVYVGLQDYNGPDAVTIHVDDLGNTGKVAHGPRNVGANGVVVSAPIMPASCYDELMLPIYVSAVNDAPVIYVPRTLVTAYEDARHPIPIAITDPDDVFGNNSMRVTMSAVHGVWTLYDIPGSVTILTGDGVDDKTLMVQGPLDSINVALASAQYEPDVDYNSFRADPDVATVVANDLGNFGAGGANIVTANFFINVRPVNDPPLLLVPGGTVVYEQRHVYGMGAVAVFTVSEAVPTVVPGIAVVDVDAAERAEGTISVTIACGHCTFRPAVTGGVRVITGRDSNGFTLFLRGALAAINAALANASYTGDTNYFGTDSVMITVNDDGNNGAGGAMNVTVVIPVVLLAVNDAPLWVLPRTAVLAVEDKGHVLSGLRVGDIDAVDLHQTMNVTVCVAHGGVTLAGESTDLTITNGTGTLDRCVSFRGDYNGTNAALDGMVYTPLHDYNTFAGRDFLELYVSDGIASDRTVLFVERVTGVNDAPKVHLPSERRIGYPCNETDTDPADTLCDWLLSVPIVTVVEDVKSAVKGISISDVDINESPRSVADVELSTYMGGVLSLPVTAGLTVHDGYAAGQRLRFSGSLRSLNAAIAALTYTGALNYNGPDNITVIVSDNGFTGMGGPLWATGTLPIYVSAVNDPIVLTMPHGSFVVVEDGTKLAVGGIRIADVDVLGGQVDVDIVCAYGEVSVIRAPGLQFTGSVRPGNTNTTFGDVTSAVEALNGALAPGVTPGSGGTTPVLTLEPEFSSHVHFRGTLAEVNYVLSGLEYMPTPNWNSAGKNRDTVTITVTDNGGSGAGSPTSDTGSFFLTVLPVNDAPVVLVPGAVRAANVWTGDGLDRVIVGSAPLFVGEDGVLPVRGVSVRDIDIDDGATGALTVTLSALYGLITVTFHEATVSASPLEQSVLGNDLTGLVFLFGDGLDDATMTFMGPIDLVNMALARISYASPRDGYGSDAVRIHVSDGGFTGAGGPMSDEQVLEVVIRAVNDAPVISVPRLPDGTNVHTVEEGESVRIWSVAVQPDDFVTAEIDDPYLMPLYESGPEMWVTRGYQPDVAGVSHLQDVIANPPTEALGETWRLSLVADLWPGAEGSAPHELTPMPDGRMYFSASDGNTGRELWVSPDGTGPTLTQVQDIYPGPVGSNPTFFTSFGGALFFSAAGIDTNWMLRADSCGGMRTSTIRITPAIAADLDSVRAAPAAAWSPSPAAADGGPPVVAFKYAAAASVQVMYAVSASTTWARGDVYDCPIGYHWASTAEGRLLFTVTHVSQAAYVPQGAVPDASEFVYFDQCGWDGFFFQGVNRTSFRFSDSHITGALKWAGGRDGDVVILNNFATAGFAGLVCIAGQDVVCDESETACTAGTGRELWVSHGASNTTDRVADIRPGAWSADPAYIVALPDRLVFTAFSDAFGAELWCSDGTAVGTRMVADVNAGWESGSPKDLAVMGARVYFSATDGLRGEELWSSDGVPSGSLAGTTIVADIRVGGAGSSPRDLVTLGSLLFFRANDGVHGVELWASDGTAAGTRMVRDISPGAAASTPSSITPFGGLVYFAASDGATGVELWVSDGTSSGTRLLRDIAIGVASSNPSLFASFSPRASIPSRLFFVVTSTPNANDYDESQLWITDGTTSGTVRAFDITAPEFDLDPTDGRSWPARLMPFNGGLFFSASRGDASVRRPPGGTYKSIGPQGGRAPGVQSNIMRQSIAVFDVDALTTPLDFTITCTKGVISLAMDQVAAPLAPGAGWAGGLVFTQGTGTGDAGMRFTATLRDANLAFRSITYTGAPLQNGDDRVVIIVNDTGARGPYGSVNVVQNGVDVWIRAVNNPPVVLVPATGPTAVMGRRAPVVGVRVFDPDSKETSRTDVNGIVHYAPMTVSVAVSAGRLTAGVTAGVSISGMASLSPWFSLTGSMDDLNTALAGLWYVCDAADACAAGAQEITVKVDDLGYTGSGGPLQASASVTVLVENGT